jgi:hypothetical protein
MAVFFSVSAWLSQAGHLKKPFDLVLETFLVHVLRTKMLGLYRQKEPVHCRKPSNAASALAGIWRFSQPTLK